MSICKQTTTLRGIQWILFASFYQELKTNLWCVLIGGLIKELISSNWFTKIKRKNSYTFEHFLKFLELAQSSDIASTNNACVQCV